MKIIIDIGHPAHVHLFKHLVWIIQQKGHKVFFTARKKEFVSFLLDKYGFEFFILGNHYKSRLGKLLGLLLFNIRLLIISIRKKPDLFLSHGSIYAAQVSWLMRKPHIALEDTGNWEQVRLYLPFTDYVLTSTQFRENYGKKQIRYNSHHEIAYLHPNHYQPSLSVKSQLQVDSSDKYVIMRFVSWNATHDYGQTGISSKMKIRVVDMLKNDYRIFISSEGELPEELEEYKISITPDNIHDALYFADLFIGEGTTMAMEAAILGTPSIYINSLQYDNVKDMESFGLLFNLENEKGLLQGIADILSIKGYKDEFRKRRDLMLDEKIDLTSLLVWLLEAYPESIQKLKTDSSLQETFR